MIHPNLYSVQLERNILGGLIKKPNVYYQLDGFLNEIDFNDPLHAKIFAIIKQILINQQNIDPIIVAQKVKEIGLDKIYDIPIYQYIDDITFTQITEKGIIDGAKELAKLRIRRELINNAEEVKRFVAENSTKTLTEIVSGVDNIYNSQIKEYSGGDEPEDLFLDVENLILDRAKNPTEDVGITTGFKIFDSTFGGMRQGVIALTGRAKSGKSTLLANIGWSAVIKEPKLKIIYLDTELKGNDHKFRAMAAFSQVNSCFIETGQWVKNKDFALKINKSFPLLKKLSGSTYHKYIGNQPIEEVLMTIKKWYFTKVGRGNPALIIYDYIKIGNEKLSNFNAEHQELGKKINSLNAISQELGIPVLTSMQLNRSAISEQKDDETAISMTDRLSWYSNNVSIFRKKRPEEVAEEGIEFGTHKLIPVVSRYQGSNQQMFDLVKSVDKAGKTIYKQNFINFNVSNFLVEERGTYRDIANKLSLNKNLMNGQSNNPEL